MVQTSWKIVCVCVCTIKTNNSLRLFLKKKNKNPKDLSWNFFSDKKPQVKKK